MAYLKVKGKPNLVRDTHTKALLNTDTSHIRKHDKRMKDIQHQEQIDKDIDILKNDIGEIKSMLKQILVDKR